MKKIKIACGTLLLAALLGWNCPVWAAEPAALAAECGSADGTAYNNGGFD